jgi:predicted ATP-grasp superfamily ATP-dependent carboligase
MAAKARDSEKEGGAASSAPSSRAVGGQPWPPVILLGGEGNTLSVARSLAKAGIKVYAINHRYVSALRSKYLTRIDLPSGAHGVEAWQEYLLSSASDHLKGSAVFCCSDEAIKLVIDNWRPLSARYILEPATPEIRLRLLDKLLLYESASACGIAHPKFWRLGAGQSLGDVLRTGQFPIILKPRLSQHSRLIGAKYLRADHAEELKRHYQRCVDLGIPVVALEFVPGGDERYCSYYTYLDDAGTPLFHFTKRLLRRHPTNEGGATYHITDWLPDVAEKGLSLFRHVGLRGLGNVEFKRDPRDGELKLIEVNARYVNGNALVTLSGIDQALLSYARLTGWPYTAPLNYRLGLVMWDPIPDFMAFRALHSRGEITFAEWIRQVTRSNTTPLYDVYDPLPGLHSVTNLAIATGKLLFKRWSLRRSGVEFPQLVGRIKP